LTLDAEKGRPLAFLRPISESAAETSRRELDVSLRVSPEPLPIALILQGDDLGLKAADVFSEDLKRD
jgi:hypothetical protein